MIFFVSPNNIQPLEHLTTVWPKLNMLNYQETRSDSKGNKATLNSIFFIGTFPKFFWEFHDLQDMVTDLPRFPPVAHPIFMGFPWLFPSWTMEVSSCSIQQMSCSMFWVSCPPFLKASMFSSVFSCAHWVSDSQLLEDPERGENTWDLLIHGIYGYGSKNGYGSFRGDPDVWNEELSASVLIRTLS